MADFKFLNLDRKIHKMTSKSLRQKVKSDLARAKDFAIKNKKKAKTRFVPRTVSISAKICSNRKSQVISFLRKRRMSQKKKIEKIKKIKNFVSKSRGFSSKREVSIKDYGTDFSDKQESELVKK